MGKKNKKRKLSQNCSGEQVSQSSISDNDSSRSTSSVIRDATVVLYGNRPATPITSTPINKESTVNMDMAVQISETNKKLDDILGKLSKLDIIEKRFESLELTVSHLKRCFDDSEKRSGDFQKSLEFFSNRVDVFESKLKETDRGMDDLDWKFMEADKGLVNSLKDQKKHIEKLEKEVQLLTQERDGIKETVEDLQWRSMKNNLVFTGLGGESNKENTEEKLRDFLYYELGIEHNIQFGSVHRFGKFERGKNRPIVARFLYQSERQLVKEKAYMLKGQPFGIHEQFPPTMVERRKKLLAVQYRLRNEGHRTKLVKDKLFVNGKIYQENFLSRSFSDTVKMQPGSNQVNSPNGQHNHYQAPNPGSNRQGQVGCVQSAPMHEHITNGPPAAHSGQLVPNTTVQSAPMYERTTNGPTAAHAGQLALNTTTQSAPRYERTTNGPTAAHSGHLASNTTVQSAPRYERTTNGPTAAHSGHSAPNTTVHSVTPMSNFHMKVNSGAPDAHTSAHPPMQTGMAFTQTHNVNTRTTNPAEFQYKS